VIVDLPAGIARLPNVRASTAISSSLITPYFLHPGRTATNAPFSFNHHAAVHHPSQPDQDEATSPSLFPAQQYYHAAAYYLRSTS
jgi:hypothetical protein